MKEFDQPIEIDGIYYKLTCEFITSQKEMIAEVVSHKDRQFGYQGNVIIPNLVNYEGTQYHVKRIGKGAFSGCCDLISIDIPVSVTSIGCCAFSGCAGLTSVTIPDRVSSIGDRAFEGCSALSSIMLPDSVTSIADRAFSGCSGLASITLPDSVTSIGDIAFEGCSALSSITIPNSLISIGDFAFIGCAGLTSVTIPDRVSSFGLDVFCDCIGLSSIIVEKGNQKYDSREDCNAIIETATNKLLVGCRKTIIPASVQAIASYAFSSCSGLTSLAIPDSVTSIGYRVFKDCIGLSSIIVEKGNQKYDSREDCNAIIETATNKLLVGCRKTIIPASVQAIADYAFLGCSDLSAITIPNSVTSIGYSAFKGCSALSAITIPNSVKEIGLWTFSGCDRLESVTISEGITEIWERAFDGCTGLTSITIPDSVTSIGAGAFSGCCGLTSVTIHDGVTSIGSSAFEGCSALSSITLPDSVTSIRDYAFCGCTDLKSITIPVGVNSIGNDAFSGCVGLKFITISDSVTSIGCDAFKDCDSIEDVQVVVKDYASFCSNKVTGLIESQIKRTIRLVDSEGKEIKEYVIPKGVTSVDNAVFSNCTGLISVTIPDSVKTIGSSAFKGCTGLSSVKIPNGIKSIGDSAFYNCSGLTSVYIPDSVTIIGACAFEGCIGFTTISIPEGVTSISSSAFKGCTGLSSVTIPNSITSIGSSAFLGCSGLASVSIPDSVTNIGASAFEGCIGFTSILIPEGVTIISSYVFEGCTNLTSVTIPDSVTSIGNHAFYGCSSLNFINIPFSVTSIGKGAFSGCNRISSITIPKGVTSIGSHAFYACNALTNVYCYSKQVLQSEEALFEDSICKHATLHVPSSALSVSPLANLWLKFHRIVSIEMQPEGSRRSYDSKSIIDGIELNYDFVDEFYQGIAIVIKNSLYGAILKGGREIITPSYDYISIFKDGYADAIRDGKCIVLDLSGKEWVRNENGTLIEGPTREETVSETKEVQNPEDENKTNIEDYDEIQVLENGLIIVSKDNLFGCVNQVGLIVVPLMYKSLSFQNNLFVASVFDEANSVIKFGVVNYVNEVVVPFDLYDEIEVRQGIITYSKKINWQETYWGAFTKSGVLICEPEYNQIGFYTDYYISVACVVSTHEGSETRWGLIDYSGAVIVPIQYEYIHKNENNNLVTLSGGYPLVVINFLGQILINSSYGYRYIGEFINGFAIVSRWLPYNLSDEEELVVYDENEKIPCELDNSNWLEPVWLKYLYGVVNSSFEEVLHCAFTSIEYDKKTGLFKTNRGYYTLDGRCIVDIEGEIKLLNKKYVYCKPFNNGYAITVHIPFDSDYRNLKIKEAKYGLINSNAEDVFPPIFDRLSFKGNGLYGYKIAGKEGRGLLNSSGEILGTNKNGLIGKFIDGLARVCNIINDDNEEKKLYGFIDAKGNEILPVSYMYISKKYNNRAVVCKNVTNKEWALFCFDTHEIINIPNASFVGPSRNDLYRINIGGDYADYRGNYPCHRYFNPRTWDVRGGHWGYINSKGQMVIEAVYDDAKNFSSGLAAVNRDGKWGFINSSGDFEIEPQYSEVSSFSADGFAAVNQNGCWGIINTSNEEVIPCEYDNVISRSDEDTFELLKNREVYVFDKTGKMITTYKQESENDYPDYDEGPTYTKYGGYNGYDDQTIDEAFGGDPSFTWNCD